MLTQITRYTAHESLTTKANLNLWFFRSEEEKKQQHNYWDAITQSSRWIIGELRHTYINKYAQFKRKSQSNKMFASLHKQNTHTTDRYCVLFELDGWSEWGSTHIFEWIFYQNQSISIHIFRLIYFVDCCLAHSKWNPFTEHRSHFI